jgi:hypothetical protein
MQDYCFVGVLTCHLAGRNRNLKEPANSIIDSIEDEGSRFLQNNDTTIKLQNITALHHKKPQFILSDMKAPTITTVK